MKKQKKQVWGNHLSQLPSEANVRFCAGRDVINIPAADEILIPYDLWTNLAHAQMLYKSKILTQKEFTSIQKGLLKINELYN